MRFYLSKRIGSVAAGEIGGTLRRRPVHPFINWLKREQGVLLAWPLLAVSMTLATVLQLLAQGVNDDLLRRVVAIATSGHVIFAGYVLGVVRLIRGLQVSPGPTVSHTRRKIGVWGFYWRALVVLIIAALIINAAFLALLAAGVELGLMESVIRIALSMFVGVPVVSWLIFRRKWSRDGLR